MPFFRRSGNARARSALKNQKSFGWKNSMAVSQIGRSANMKRAIDNRAICCGPTPPCDIVPDTFGVGGIVLTPITRSGTAVYARIEDFVVNSCNEIIVVGLGDTTDRSADPNTTDANILLAKYSARGDLVTSFGTDGTGIVKLELSSTEDSVGYGIVLDSNDNIFISGFAKDDSDSGYYKFIIAKYLPNGQLDTSWQTNGYNRIEYFVGPRAESFSLIIDNEDNFVLVGWGSDYRIYDPSVPQPTIVSRTCKINTKW